MDLAVISEIITNLIKQSNTMREFSRKIGEDPSDVIRWKTGKAKVKPRAAVTIYKLYDIHPSELRPDVFPKNMRITFEKDK